VTVRPPPTEIPPTAVLVAIDGAIVVGIPVSEVYAPLVATGANPLTSEAAIVTAPVLPATVVTGPYLAASVAKSLIVLAA
jgi:hypothetical protein